MKSGCLDNGSTMIATLRWTVLTCFYIFFLFFMALQKNLKLEDILFVINFPFETHKKINQLIKQLRQICVAVSVANEKYTT